MTTLVFSYSHADEALRNELEKHLSPLKRARKITTWHDRRIVPGQEFERQIDQYFSEADIILLLISSDFIASDYCYEVEMTNALARHKRGGGHSCDLKRVCLASVRIRQHYGGDN
ncbi:toll/interleukin-1 receptor domain-containing protein [Enterobacter ludwigii]|uniref:toll/interleukin-1 receptor domain-containing protein n=1 Tax=Enterobacter ludwigii TaxID=299767 RepID=UPI003C2B323C